MTAGRRSRIIVATVALLVPLTSAWTAPAAATDAMSITGFGTISPGLPSSGCQRNSVTFASTATVNAGDHSGTYSFSFSGSDDSCATMLNSHGDGYLSGDISGSLTYSRTGLYFAFGGQITMGGDTGPFFARCGFVPTNVNPVNSYALACVGFVDLPVTITCSPFCASEPVRT